MIKKHINTIINMALCLEKCPKFVKETVERVAANTQSYEN